MDRTPPHQAEGLADKVRDLNNLYLDWRKQLQKANTARVKILRALQEVGCDKAAAILGAKPRDINAERCGHCPGCMTMVYEKACHKCQGC